MAMAHSLGFGALALHWRDGAPGAATSSSVRFYRSRRAPQRLVLSPLSNRERLSVRCQSRSPAQDQAAGSAELQTVSVPPTQPAYIGSPLLWVGVGVGLSVLFSWAANYVKKQAMQQALKSMMSGPGQNQFGNMPIPPFPFPVPPQPQQQPMQTFQPPVSSSQATQPQASASATAVVESTEATSYSETQTPTPVSENNKPAFTDVNVEAEVSTVKINAEATEVKENANDVFFKDAEVRDSGTGFTWNTDGAASTSSSDGKANSFFSVENLEKMLEDPTVQQMVYPYLPQEMRNPSTFKWMMQNPQFRTQLQEMLNNMTEDGAWKNGQMGDVLKNFNPNNQELKQQFEQIGLSPEEVMAKMVANPEIAMAFQNPKIQAALIDCSQNPTNITKYQNDKEVMDVFNKIAELFPIKGF
ncbi:protein TIC 40, chloroplastic [Selaginella moellendorffii]|uniref:protein TIC 40, chloroplastic n=1 Tax=Selaginella moellendorffii TaxID=88036 RepID=UPI000D1CF7D9|nr:protein TIC 40, chloroplastic [Selaginella moellendorffii]|eukprot:XP_024544115.1 protein TIC 40, chloroplastic [Selaginella moellendorffii]